MSIDHQEPKIENEPQKDVSLSDSDWQSILEGVWLGSDYSDEEGCARLREVARKLEQKLGK